MKWCKLCALVLRSTTDVSVLECLLSLTQSKPLMNYYLQFSLKPSEMTKLSNFQRVELGRFGLTISVFHQLVFFIFLRISLSLILTLTMPKSNQLVSNNISPKFTVYWLLLSSQHKLTSRCFPINVSLSLSMSLAVSEFIFTSPLPNLN